MKSRKPGEKEMEALRTFQRSSQANKKCFDCGERGPTYICIDPEYKTFVCSSCSGLHRELSHKIKGIGVSKWTKEEVDAIVKLGGNDAAATVLLAKWRTKDEDLVDPHSVEKMRNFIRMKYQDRRWADTDSAANNQDDRPKDSTKQRDEREEKREKTRDTERHSDTHTGNGRHLAPNRTSAPLDFNPGGATEVDFGDFGDLTSTPRKPEPDIFSLDQPPAQASTNGVTARQGISGSSIPEIIVLSKELIAQLPLGDIVKLQKQMEDALRQINDTINAQLALLNEQERVLHAQKNERQQAVTMAVAASPGGLNNQGTNAVADFPTHFDLGSIKLSADTTKSYPNNSAVHNNVPDFLAIAPSVNSNATIGSGGTAAATAMFGPPSTAVSVAGASVMGSDAPSRVGSQMSVGTMSWSMGGAPMGQMGQMGAGAGGTHNMMMGAMNPMIPYQNGGGFAAMPGMQPDGRMSGGNMMLSPQPGAMGGPHAMGGAGMGMGMGMGTGTDMGMNYQQQQYQSNIAMMGGHPQPSTSLDGLVNFKTGAGLAASNQMPTSKVATNSLDNINFGGPTNQFPSQRPTSGNPFDAF